VIKHLVAVALILSIALSAAGQTTCIIEGRVSDSETESFLPGVNVMIRGSYYGGATDLDGRFRLTGMSPGTYDLEFSMIGYKVVQKTGVAVTSAEPVFVEIMLEQTTLALGQEIVVEGERPLLEVDQTSSSVRLSADDLKMNIVENAQMFWPSRLALPARIMRFIFVADVLMNPCSLWMECQSKTPFPAAQILCI